MKEPLMVTGKPGSWTLALLCAVVLTLLVPPAADAQSSLQDFLEKKQKQLEELKTKAKKSTQPKGPSGTSSGPQGQPPMPVPAPPAADEPAARASAGAAPVTIPVTLVLYKHARQAVSEELLLEQAERQIQQDQFAYKDPKSFPGHVFVFSKAQVEGRVAKFVAKELMPVYEAHLARLAGQVPDRLAFRGVTALDWLEYRDGTLRMKTQPYLVRVQPVLEQDKRRLPPEMQGRHVVARMPTIEARVGAAGLAETTPERLFRQQARLALDRDPSVAPLAMKSADAERVWQRPQCSSSQVQLMQKGMSRDDAAREASECQALMAQYRGVVDGVFEIAIDGVTITDQIVFLQARLLGATIEGPSGPLARLAPEDFVSAEGRQAAAQQEREREAQRAAEQRDERNAALARMDLLGVRVGMPVQEAERTVRAGVKVDTVYRFSAAPPPRNASAAAARPFQPYDRGLLFLANDGNEVIALFHRDDGTVIAVTRRMRVDGLTREALKTGLTEKYGTPTKDESRAWIWGDTGKGAACAGDGAIDRQSTLELLEGQRGKQGKHVDPVMYSVVGVGVRHGTRADTLASCHTVLQVRANLESPAKSYVDLRLFDHSTVADALKAIEGGKKAGATDAAGRLKF
jgi:hypothetical protein